jgi:SnoaL-like domain
MPTDTAEVITKFNDAFVQRDHGKLVDLVADDCVMESAQPAPNGTRYQAYDACLGFWREQIADPNGSFEPEDVVVSDDRATIRWRYRFGEGTRTRCAASISCTSATGRSWKHSDM